MTKSEEIAQILKISSTDVIVTNGKEAQLKDRELTESEQEQIAHVFWSDEKKEFKEETKALKAENKALKERIADSTDFNDLKGKLSQIKDSEENPPKWSDKSYYLKGQYVEHKNINYRVLEDHESDKDKEPDVTPEWYKPV